jgi:predicted O-methyltransferase YrrM
VRDRLVRFLGRGRAGKLKQTRLYALTRVRTGRRPESNWSEPAVDCAHPEWWHATDLDSTELEVTELVVGFIRALQPEFVVETGTAFGQTARAIGRALKKNGHGHLVTLEPDPVRVRQARAVTAGLPVEVVQLASLDYTPTAPIDFAWFDSLIELRVEEFRRFLPFMHKGTVVGFHDTAPRFGLAPQLAELEARGEIRAMRLPTPRGVTFAQPAGLS